LEVAHVTERCRQPRGRKKRKDLGKKKKRRGRHKKKENDLHDERKKEGSYHGNDSVDEEVQGVLSVMGEEIQN